MNNINKIIFDHINVIQKLHETNSDLICLIGEIIIKRLQSGSKLIFMGNGGSASDAQHLSAEFVGRFLKEREPLSAISLSTDTSALTAIGNDYGFDKIFERQINALAKEGDIVIGITTSGNSPNVLRAIEAANNLNCFTIGLTGRDGGKLKDICNETIIVPSNITARIQETHILIGHILCDMVDTAFN